MTKFQIFKVLSEHLEPETVPFHCHSPQVTVLFVVHVTFTSSDIILIGIAFTDAMDCLLVRAARKK